MPSPLVTLPSGIDGDHVKASLDKGVLTVIVPKTPEAKPKTISVETSPPKRA